MVDTPPITPLAHPSLTSVAPTVLWALALQQHPIQKRAPVETRLQFERNGREKPLKKWKERFQNDKRIMKRVTKPNNESVNS